MTYLATGACPVPSEARQLCVISYRARRCRYALFCAERCYALCGTELCYAAAQCAVLSWDIVLPGSTVRPAREAEESHRFPQR
eukprot:2584043-Rhodomonas_salina.2